MTFLVSASLVGVVVYDPFGHMTLNPSYTPSGAVQLAETESVVAPDSVRFSTLHGT